MSFEYITLFLISLIVAIDATGCESRLVDTLNVPEDGRLNCSELMKKYGYPPEVYHVTTKDGFILELYHIPGNKSKPVLLLHGIFDTSCGWFLRGNRSLGIMAAEEGYDLFAMNFRGNRYSRKHVTLDPNKDEAFWNFSQHEFGTMDLSVVIDFVLNKTEQKQLSVVGFSEGTSSVFVLGSTLPEYNKKVKIFIALAPIAFMDHVRPALSILIKISPFIDFILPQSVQEFSGYNSIEKALLNILCTRLPISYELCYQGGINSLSGPDTKGIEREFLPIIFGHFPAGTSRKNLLHFAKISLQKSYRQYDYGTAENLRVYNSMEPPVYDLSKMTIDTVTIRGSNDSVSTMEDVERLLGIIPNVVESRVVNDYNHLEFMWGRDAPETTYGYVLDMLKKYN